MDLSSSLKFVHGVCHFVFFVFRWFLHFWETGQNLEKTKKTKWQTPWGPLLQSQSCAWCLPFCFFVFSMVFWCWGIVIWGGVEKHAFLQSARLHPPLIPPFWKQNMEPTHWRLSVVIRSILRIQVWPIMIHVLCLRCWKQDGREVLHCSGTGTEPVGRDLRHSQRINFTSSLIRDSAVRFICCSCRILLFPL